MFQLFRHIADNRENIGKSDSNAPNLNRN